MSRADLPIAQLLARSRALIDELESRIDELQGDVRDKDAEIARLEARNERLAEQLAQRAFPEDWDDALANYQAEFGDCPPIIGLSPRVMAAVPAILRKAVMDGVRLSDAQFYWALGVKPPPAEGR